MTRSGFFWRLALSIVIDIADGIFGRLPVFGTVTDGIGTVVLWALWGPAGLINAWELVDITDQVDGFIPTATLIGLYVGWKNGIFSAGSRNVTPTNQDAP